MVPDETGGPAPDRVAASFDAAAPSYDTHGVAFFAGIAARLVKHAEIMSGDQMLDVGCGAGAVTIAAARAVGTAGHVTSIDLSPKMLARTQGMCAALRLSNVSLALADAHDPPYAAESFDVVVASMVIFLLADHAAAVRAWLRVLRPGGRLAFSWNIAEDPRWQPVIAAVDAHVPGQAGLGVLLHHRPFGSITDVEAMLADAGYASIATTAAPVVAQYAGPRHWWAASWTQAPRIAWQYIPDDKQAVARDKAFGLLRDIRNPDGTLTRRAVIGYTTARRSTPSVGKERVRV
jgi:SAM-dependent methyltransferase